jgi:ferrochelatase
MEARDAFLAAGGKEFHYIACLNADEAWITALCGIAQQHMVGWPTAIDAEPQAPALAASRAAALALGAAQ